MNLACAKTGFCKTQDSTVFIVKLVTVCVIVEAKCLTSSFTNKNVSTALLLRACEAAKQKQRVGGTTPSGTNVF